MRQWRHLRRKQVWFLLLFRDEQIEKMSRRICVLSIVCSSDEKQGRQPMQALVTLGGDFK